MLRTLPISAYTILQGLILLGYMFHHTEDWGSIFLASFSMVSLLLFVLFPRLRELVFFSFLSLAIGDYLWAFPDLANHSNLTFFLLLLLLPVQWIILRAGRLPDLDQLFRTLRWTVFLLYFFTIFHKLNWDFLNPEVSCANDKLDKYLELIPPSYDYLHTTLLKVMPFWGWLIEAAVPILIAFGKTRSLGIIFVVVLHFVLAPMGFTDFSSLAMALAWCFLNHEKIDLKNTWRHLRWLIAACLTMELIFAFGRYEEGIETYEILEGGLFILFYLPFIIKHYLPNVSRKNLIFPKFKWQRAFLAIFFLFGFSNYLGLRTAGTFSMFSNLMTEGEKSNHILLGTNPFKIFNYQEDVVEIIKADSRIRGFYRRMPRPEQKIPKVEFSRILDIFRENRWRDIRMTIRYQGKVYRTLQAGFDPSFDKDALWIEKKLLKFRHIQLKGPQFCHW